MARNAREEIVRVWRVVGCAWTWGIILVLALGLVGQLVRDRAVWLALLMYLPILPVGILAFVQDLVQKGRAMPRVRFGLTMLALMAIIWTIAHMTGSGRGVQAAGDSGEPVRLVQWNVMWGTRGRANWWSTVVDDVAGQQPDIVILNEGPSEPFLEALLTRLGPGWNSTVSKDSMRHPGYWYNLAICSRWPVQKLDEQPIATGQIQRAVIHSPGGPIRVLQVDGTSDPRHPRRGRLGDVARSVQQAHDAGEDIDIIAGDFNTVSRSVGFEQIEDAGPAFNRASDHASWRGTWPSIFPLYDIDHVFVSSRWRTGSDEMLFNRHLDHRGQVVVLAPVVPAAAWHTPSRPLGFAAKLLMTLLTDPNALAALAATAAMATACACLSVIVVARRWAFVGEGIAHSGFGGAGVAWLIMLAVPRLLTAGWLPYLAMVVFCLVTAIAIGHVSRSPRISADTAIGIFMVASLAFGFLAQQIFRQFKSGAEPPGFPDILFGHFSGISRAYSILAIAVAITVIATLVALGKEILYYCLDPISAQASGVPAAAIHYLLMILIALTVVIGIPITGSVLVTALLVLPAATANLLSRKIRTVLATSIIITLVASITGVTLSLSLQRIRIPAGPAIVLLLFAIFLLVYLLTRVRPASR